MKGGLNKSDLVKLADHSSPDLESVTDVIPKKIHLSGTVSLYIINFTWYVAFGFSKKYYQLTLESYSIVVS